MIKNIIANFIGKFWSLFSVFFFIPIYIEILGFENYSVISFTLIIAGLVVFMDSGLTATLSREFSKNTTETSNKKVVLKSLEVIYSLIVFIIIILLILFSNYIASNWIVSEIIPLSKISFIIKVLGFDIGFQMLFRFYMGGFYGLEKQIKANIIQILWGIIRNGLVLIIIYFKPDIEIFFIWQALCNVAFAIITRKLIYRELKGESLEVGIPFFDISVIKTVWKFAGGMMMISMVAALNSQLDKIMISKMLNLESLGYYSLSISLASGLLVIVSPISVALLPRFTFLYSSNQKEKAIYLYRIINKYVSILIFSISIVLFFFSREIIWVWTGNLDIANNSYKFLPYIVLAYSMLSIITIPYNIAIANGYTKLSNILGIIGILITIPGYWYFIQLYGAIGAAMVYCTVQAVIAGVFYFVINKKYIHLPNSLLIKNLIYPIIISAITMYLFDLLSFSFYHSRIQSLLWIGCGGILVLLINVLILSSKSELKQFLNYIRPKNG